MVKKTKKVKSTISPVSIKEKEIGRVSGYYSHVGVAAVKLSSGLKVGDKIHFKGHSNDFKLTVKEMQIERKNVKTAKKGDHIGIKVPEKVRPSVRVYLAK